MVVTLGHLSNFLIHATTEYIIILYEISNLLNNIATKSNITVSHMLVPYVIIYTKRICNMDS